MRAVGYSGHAINLPQDITSFQLTTIVTDEAILLAEPFTLSFSSCNVILHVSRDYN